VLRLFRNKRNKNMAVQKTKLPKLSKQALTFAIIMSVVGTVVGVPIAKAATLQQQIDALNAENAAKKQQTQSLKVEANGIEDTISSLQTQIDGLQAQINDNTTKSQDLEKQIAEAQTELERQRKLLGSNIKAMYLEGDISTIEMLATSKDLSDYFDKQQYRDVVKTKIKTTLEKVTALKAQLKTQQEELQRLITEQQTLRGQVVSQRNEQDRLLNLNAAQRSSLDAEMKANFSQISELRRQQAAAQAALTGSNGSSVSGGSITFKNLTGGVRCGGGYAYCNYALDQFVYDPWGLYLARECVHYVAWALDNRGYINSSQYFSGNGNANQWEGVMERAGEATVDNNPEGAQAVWMPITGSSIGHIAIVEYVSDGWAHISQYNWQPGMYSEMDLKVTSNLRFFHF